MNSHAFDHFPSSIIVRSGTGEFHYVRKNDCHAVHGFAGIHRGDPPLLALEDPPVRVFAGLPESVTTGTVSPVYTLGPGPAMFIPTGHLLVEFDLPVSDAEVDAVLGRHRLRTQKRVPHTERYLWAVSVSGDIAQALNAETDLKNEPLVRSTQAQLVTRSSRRE